MDAPEAVKLNVSAGDALAEGTVFQKQKVGRSNYCIITQLFDTFAGESMREGT